MSNRSDEIKTVLLYGGGLAALYFGVVRPITNAVGLTKGADEKQKEAQIQSSSKAPEWDPKFWQMAPNGSSLITVAGGKLLSERIHSQLGIPKLMDVFGILIDTEKIYSVLRMLKTKTQASQLCWYYEKFYGQDLFEKLRTKLNDAEMLTAVNIVKDLPKYKPK